LALLGNAVREVETSEQCRWAECGNGNRWQTSFSLIVVKAGSGGVQPLASLRRMGPAGGRRRRRGRGRGGGDGVMLKKKKIEEVRAFQP